MTSILEAIRAYKLDEIAAAKAALPAAELEAAARAAPPPRGFARTLAHAAATGWGLIAEIKRASPSKGLIRAEFDPASLARAYAAGGAACLSVLTDGPSFAGAPEHLTAARAACDLPVLRKDFLFDPWQVAEARAWGADCILIIMAAVDDAQAADLAAAAAAWGMDALVEVHDRAELDRAVCLPAPRPARPPAPMQAPKQAPMIGINNRDLHSFAVSLETTRELARRVPEDRLVVSESGLFTPEDLAGLAAYGVRAFLIGEALLRAPDVAAATRAILRRPAAQGGL